jgi:quercetin dioxygenase-like cupin family protein
VGVSVHVLVRAGDTGGAWSLVDYELPPRFAGPPPHVHAGITEAFYCTEGTLALMLDGQAVTLRAGEVAVVPPGVPHAFANPSDAPARMLLWLTPGGFERYFDDLAALAAASPVWPPADPEAMAAVAARYDLVPAAAVRQAAGAAATSSQISRTPSSPPHTALVDAPPVRASPVTRRSPARPPPSEHLPCRVPPPPASPSSPP